MMPAFAPATASPPWLSSLEGMEDFDFPSMTTASNPMVPSVVQSPIVDAAASSGPTSFDYPVGLQDRSTHASRRECQCLGTLVRLLEDLGMQLNFARSDELDGLIACIRRGTVSCGNVLDCNDCRLHAENGMLFATVVQQLGEVCAQVRTLLLSHRCGEERVAGAAHANYSIAVPTSLLRGTISLGTYQIDAPQIQNSLVMRLILIHLNDLLPVIARLKAVIGHRGNAWKLIVGAEDQALRVLHVARELDAQ